MSTKIEWTDRTWNPIVGCSRVSEACRHCYAERMAGRLEAMGLPQYAGVAKDGRWTGRVNLVESALEKPLHWRKPQKIFVNSMSDLFHESVPDEWIDRVFAVMLLAERHDFQVLTKRPERMLHYMENLTSMERIGPLKGEDDEERRAETERDSPALAEPRLGQSPGVERDSPALAEPRLGQSPGVVFGEGPSPG